VETAEWAFNHRMGTLMLQVRPGGAGLDRVGCSDCWLGCGWLGLAGHAAACRSGSHRATLTSCPRPKAPATLQSGELNTPQRMQYLIDVVRAVKQRTQALDAQQRSLDPAHLPKDTTGLGLCVALSGVVRLGWGGGNRAAHSAAVGGAQSSGHVPCGLLKFAFPCCGCPLAVGELPREKYQQLKDAGADRYLLRIESSNPQLYASIHPPAQARGHARRQSRDSSSSSGSQCAACLALPGGQPLPAPPDRGFYQYACLPALPVRRSGRTGFGA
jgi:hypothetical protein